jgi:Xaa-Pro aminopeptidase
MPTFLLYGDALAHPLVRHEVGEAIFDPIVFLEHGGRRIVATSDFDDGILRGREELDEVWGYMAALDAERLYADHSFPQSLIGAELVRRAVARVGADEVTVPGSFPVLVADYLRAKEVGVVVDEEVWALRRRRKTASELAGIERAQRAAERAMLAAARMLREAERVESDGHLSFEGKTLTAEWIREVMAAELLGQGAESDEILVQSGDACLAGHEPGSGPIVADQSLIIDCFPRDRRSGCYSDMTRTFVPGRPSAKLRELHAHCREALDIALEALRPGRSDAYRLVARFFADKGYPTQLEHGGDDVLVEGFSHSLGHGVGLEVHERPFMGRRAEELAPGDVVAVEPGLYFKGVGGVRLEDTVRITESGCEPLTAPLPYDLAP